MISRVKKLIKKLNYDNLFAAFGTLILLFIFPLFMQNKYFNITISKFLFFLSVSVIFFIICLFCNKFLNNTDNQKQRLSIKEKLLKSDKTDISYFILIIFGAVTVFFSDFKSQAIIGSNGRFMGYLFFLVSGLSYFFISRYNILQEYEFIAFEVSMSLVCILGIFQACGIDLFNLISSVSYEQRDIFISTLGNIDVFSSFLALALPISMYMICFKERKSKLFIFYLISVAFGFWGLLLSNSDSGFLGIFAAFWVICLLSFKSRETLTRFCELCMYFFALAFLYGLFKRQGIIKRELSFISNLLTKPEASCVFIVLFIFASLILRFVNINEKQLKILKKVYIIFSVVLISVTVFSVIYFTKINTSYELGSFENYLRFNDRWGTNRGFVWRIYLELYNGLPLSQKLFGCGQDCLSLALTENLKKEMITFGNYTNNAHNEYLQYLVSIGVFGLAAYICLVVSALIKFFKDKENTLLSCSAAVSVIAYLVQASVNITQPIVTPLLIDFRREA